MAKDMSAMPNSPAIKVFIVDDDEAVRESFIMLLESYGFEASAYPSAEAFAASWHSGGRACLVLDHNLGGVSGLDFVAAADGVLRDLPVILITGRGDANVRARACRLGVAAYLEKPVAGHALVNAIAFATGSAA
jgi:FixJ family two-component response regulator